MEILKKCTTCCLELSLDQFRAQSKNKDGKKYTCKACDDKKAKKRYSEKKEHIISKVKEWQGKNPDKLKIYKENNILKKKTKLENNSQSCNIP